MTKGGGSRIARSLDRARARVEGVGFQQVQPTLKALLILLALFAVFHLYELTHFSLSIDDEYGAFRQSSAIWIGQGRWTAYLFEKFVLPQPVLPFLPLALFGLLLAIGYLLFLRAIGESRPGPLSFALFPLFASFPTWSYLTAFQSNTPSAGLGVVLSCWAAFVFRNGRERSTGRNDSASVACAGLIGAVAIGCYQSFSLLIAVVLLATVMSMSLAGRPARLVLRDCIAAIAVLAISLVLYALILKLFLIFSRSGISYIQGFVRLEALRDQPGQVVLSTLQQMKGVYFGRELIYGYASPVIIVLIATAAAGVVCHAHRVAGHRGLYLAGLCILALLAAPFGMNLMSGGSMPLRSLVAVPVALTGLGWLGFKYGPRWLSHLGVVVLLLVYFSMFKSLSGFNAARELVQVHDRQLALALSERIASVAGPAEAGKPLVLDVFGFQSFKPPYPRKDESTIGVSFFEWDGGNPHRIVTYMKLIGLPTFGIVAPSQRAGLLDEFVGMPSWPANGSVRATAEGVILVKLSDVPSMYYRPLLVGKDPLARADDKPFYRLSGAAGGSWSVQNASAPQKTDAGIILDTKIDPQLMFETGAPRIVESCSRIELHASLRIERPTIVQVFYKKPGQAEFSGERAMETLIAPAADGGFVDVNLQLISRDGFADSFRLDPVYENQRVTIGEAELFCRHERPGAE